MQEIIIVFCVCLLLVYLVKKIEMRNYSDRERFRPLWFKCAIKDHFDENKTHYARRVLVKAVEADDPDWIDFYREGNIFWGYEYFANYCRRPTERENEEMRTRGWCGKKREYADDKIIRRSLGRSVGIMWPAFEIVKRKSSPWRTPFRRPTKYEYASLYQPN